MADFATNIITQPNKYSSSSGTVIIEGLNLTSTQLNSFDAAHITGFSVHMLMAAGSSPPSNYLAVRVGHTTQTGDMTSGLTHTTYPYSIYNSYSDEKFGSVTSLNGLSVTQAKDYVSYASMTVEFEVVTSGITLYTNTFQIILHTTIPAASNNITIRNGFINLTSGKISL